jgi:hypothetical protein
MAAGRIEQGEHEEVGLQDGGHVILKCSACRKSLVDVWVTRPEDKFTWTFQATCGYCGDKSFEKEITGGFHVGGYCKKLNKDDPEEERPDLVIEDMYPDGNKMIIVTKVNKSV